MTVILEALPESMTGRISRHEFTTTLGAAVIFEKSYPVQGRETFKMSVLNNGQVWTAVELRELAAECQEMAKYLDKIST